MKKIIFLHIITALVMITTGTVYSQTTADQADGTLSWSDPVSKTIEFSADNFGLEEEDGIIHAGFIESETAEKGVFPERYDARENGFITPVKDQRPYDLCWAESTLSMAESNLIKKGYADPGIDLSEVFAHYFQWFREPDPLGLTSGDQNIWRAYESYPGYMREWINSWGSGYRAVLLFSGWPGIASENTAPYPSEDADITNFFLDPALSWNSSIASMKEANWISMQDTQAIKRMIMKKGSAVIAFYQSRAKYLNEETGAYYDPVFNYSNHLVNVIGWDDNYPAVNFLERPELDGAWLVKNSFGTDWGNDGYFWLSYQDKSISADAFFFDFEPIDRDTKCYQYDGTVSYNYINDPNSGLIAAANIFTAVDNEKLTAVSFITPSSYFSYKIEIYRGVKNTPDSGVLFSRQTGEKLYAGYHTIDLDTPVDLVSGDRFSVIVEISTNAPGTAYIMTDRSESYTVNDANGNAVVYQEFISNSNPGESFYRTKNGNWVDCWNEDPTYSLGNVRIKALTKLMSFAGAKTVQTTSGDMANRQPVIPQFYILDWDDRPVPVPHF